MAQDALAACGVQDGFKLRPLEIGQAWDATMVSSFRLKAESVEKALAFANRLKDDRLKNKISFVANLMELIADSGIVLMLLDASTMDDRKCDTENLTAVTQLRRRLSMLKHSATPDALSAYDSEPRLRVPFTVSITGKEVFDYAGQVAVDIVQVWVNDVDSMIKRLTDLVPPWQPVREKLLSDQHEIAVGLMNCEHFGLINAIADTLLGYSDAMKQLNKDGFGLAVHANVFKQISDTRALATDTVCLAFALATWHTSIKVERNTMQRGKKITDLRDGISSRGSTFTDQMTQALDSAAKADFKPDVPEEPEEPEEPLKKKKRARK